MKGDVMLLRGSMLAEPAALQPGLTRDELIKALEGHAKSATGLIGLFSKP
jgi:hypothetical protein